MRQLADVVRLIRLVDRLVELEIEIQRVETQAITAGRTDLVVDEKTQASERLLIWIALSKARRDFNELVELNNMIEKEEME